MIDKLIRKNILYIDAHDSVFKEREIIVPNSDVSIVIGGSLGVEPPGTKYWSESEVDRYLAAVIRGKCYYWGLREMESEALDEIVVRGYDIYSRPGRRSLVEITIENMVVNQVGISDDSGYIYLLSNLDAGYTIISGKDKDLPVMQESFPRMNKIEEELHLYLEKKSGNPNYGWILDTMKKAHFI